MSEPTKFLLDEQAIPTHWVNLAPELPGDPLPPLSPRTGEPAGPDVLAPIFPPGLIAQEVATEPEVAIPDPVREAYKLWRPTPLHRARVPSARSARARASSTSTRASPPPARTSPTPPSRRPTRTRRPARRSLRRRRAPASGARRWRSRARCSGS